MSAKGNHTISVVNGPEKYETLKESFSDVFNDINNSITNNNISIGGVDLTLEYFLGGDYKFILMMMGLKQATSNYSCVWCKIYKQDRWVMSHDMEYYDSHPLKRTLEEIIEKSKNKGNKKKYCCEFEPLLHIDTDHIILDELHLLLRILDVLINNIGEECVKGKREF